MVWSSGQNGNSIQVGPGTYSATCQENKCSSAPSSDITITAKAYPGDAVLSASQTTLCAGSTTDLTASGCMAGATYHWSTGQLGSTITVTPPATTVYSAYCELDGCRSDVVMSIEIAVNPVPAAPHLNNLTVCAGSSAVLTPFGCSGTLSSLTETAIVLSGGYSNTVVSYSMVCTESGCNSQPGVGSITYLAIPDVPQLTATAGTNGTVLCPGNAVTLSVTNCGGGAVNWSNGMLGDSIILYPTGPQTLSVTCNNGSCASEARPILIQQP